jgi:hypothetical protein
MWEYLSENSRQILTGAYLEAGKLGVSYLGSEHIMLAILNHRHNTACRELKTLGVDLTEFREKILEKVKRRDPKSAGEITFSARAARILEVSLAIAIALEKKLVGSEHLLLALLKEGIGLPAATLKDFYGVTTETILEELYGIKNIESKSFAALKDITGSGLRIIEEKIQSANIQRLVIEGKVDEIIHITDYLGDLLESVNRPDLVADVEKIRNKIISSFKEEPHKESRPEPKSEITEDSGIMRHRTNLDKPDADVKTGLTVSAIQPGITVSVHIDRSTLKDLIMEAINESGGYEREKSGFKEQD